MVSDQQNLALVSKLKLLAIDLFHFMFFVVGLSLGIMISLYITTSWFIPTNNRNVSNYTVHATTWSPPAPIDKAEAFEEKKSISNMHNMSDEELMERVLMAERIEVPEEFVPKVAFLFLSYGDLPLAPLWEKFFQGHRGFYSIYRHTHPSHNDSVLEETSVFYGTRVPSQPVYWGTSTMMDAERRLLANALLDISNQRFVLLSESCIPLFDFKTIYNYLINTVLSFQASFDDPGWHGRGRYHPRMSPTITISEWRKGSQWFELNRDLALLVATEKKYYSLFQKFCHPGCYTDEHYIPTLLNIMYPDRNSNRTVTWVDWSRGGPHPGFFGWNDMTEDFLNNIRFGSQCSYNGNETSMCFMFARKIQPVALEQLMRIAPVLLGLDP